MARVSKCNLSKNTALWCKSQSLALHSTANIDSFQLAVADADPKHVLDLANGIWTPSLDILKSCTSSALESLPEVQNQSYAGCDSIAKTALQGNIENFVAVSPSSIGKLAVFVYDIYQKTGQLDTRGAYQTVKGGYQLSLKLRCLEFAKILDDDQFACLIMHEMTHAWIDLPGTKKPAPELHVFDEPTIQQLFALGPFTTPFLRSFRHFTELRGKNNVEGSDHITDLLKRSQRDLHPQSWKFDARPQNVKESLIPTDLPTTMSYTNTTKVLAAHCRRLADLYRVVEEVEAPDPPMIQDDTSGVVDASSYSARTAMLDSHSSDTAEQSTKKIMTPLTLRYMIKVLSRVTVPDTFTSMESRRSTILTMRWPLLRQHLRASPQTRRTRPSRQLQG